MPKHSKKMNLFGLILLAFLGGCFWTDPDVDSDFLPLNDSEYPYADLPRVVIELEHFRQIRDVKTTIPARLQIYGDTSAVSEVYHLTVRGRGNSSAKMPKYGLKLEFENEEEMFGMPKNRDWALVANFGEKTHLRNYLMSRLSEWLGASYTPRMCFVELYLNREYMGLYLFTETVKVAKKRVNISENDSTFLIEKEDSKKLDFPNVKTEMNNNFHVKSPKNLTESSRLVLLNRLNEFENFLRYKSSDEYLTLQKFLNLEDFFLYYWVQEFSKNEDGNFARSTFMTLEKNGQIHFGPLWDFDLGFGNESQEINQTYRDWYVRVHRWFYFIFGKSGVDNAAKKYWNEHREQFRALADSIPLYRRMIEKAVRNEYKRWPVLQNTENWALKKPYGSYDEAVKDMEIWMKKRYEWICSQYD